MVSLKRDSGFLIASHSFSISLIATMFWTPSNGFCIRQEELTGSTTDTAHYSSPGFTHSTGYKNNNNCRVLFRAAYQMDSLKIDVTDSDMEPRDNNNICLDRVVFYDGPTTDDSVLGEFCGRETPSFESSGSTVLMVFQTNNINDRNYKGFQLKFVSLDRGGKESYKPSKKMGVGAIVGIVIPAVLIYCVLFAFVYRRCKYSHQDRQNSGNAGSRPAEMRMAMLDQSSQGLIIQHVGNGHNQLAFHEPTGIDMQALADQQSTFASDQQRRRGRVRHPAGDLRNVEFMPPNPATLLNSKILHGAADDGCSGYSSEREESARLQDFRMAEPHFVHSSALFAQDPSGVFYAGNIDEHGILHPPSGEIFPVYPLAPAPSMTSSALIQSYLSQHLEDDRRSRGSSRSRRSPYTSGRNSPRDGSSGHGSPFRNRGNNPAGVYSGSPRMAGFLDTGGQTLTYYGMIDGVGSSAAVPEPGLSATADNVSNATYDLSVPPPSYEDASTGKYSPTLMK
ncbi:unnamed protein product [Lymnaea stagnalis]|uniref:CUB domain-containing protein n=1 Tax=Lymnaea stagnalis TaxID=6523 RepID=A0AAV2I610_LYMST